MTVLFLFTAYADDPTFFFKDIASVIILVNTFKLFSCFFGLKPNVNRCEIACSGILEKTEEAVSDLQNIDLTNGTIEILATHFSCNKKIQTKRNHFTTFKEIQKALNLWITRTPTLEGKIVGFETLGISKVV